MAVREMAVFTSPSQARQAYYTGGDDGGSGDGSGDGDGDGEADPDPSEGWGEPEVIDQLGNDWALLSQQRLEGDKTRYFVLYGPNGNEAMQTGGGTITVQEGDTWDDLPTFETEDAAREAYEMWLEEATDGDGEGDSGKEGWTQWEQSENIPPWFIFERTEINGDGVEYVISGEHDDRGTIYLNPGVEVVEENPHIYTSREAVGEALMAYFKAVEEGEVDDTDRPNGSAPTPEDVAEGTDNGGDSLFGGVPIVGDLADMASENPMAVIGLVIVLAALYYYYGGYNG